MEEGGGGTISQPEQPTRRGTWTLTYLGLELLKIIFIIYFLQLW